MESRALRGAKQKPLWKACCGPGTLLWGCPVSFSLDNHWVNAITIEKTSLPRFSTLSQGLTPPSRHFLGAWVLLTHCPPCRGREGHKCYKERVLHHDLSGGRTHGMRWEGQCGRWEGEGHFLLTGPLAHNRREPLLTATSSSTASFTVSKIGKPRERKPASVWWGEGRIY